MIPSLQAFATGTSAVKIAHYQIAYKPFLSIFNMTNVAGSGLFPNPDVCAPHCSCKDLRSQLPYQGIVDCATSVPYREAID